MKIVEEKKTLDLGNQDHILHNNFNRDSLINHQKPNMNKILIADDCSFNLMAMQGMLECFNFIPDMVNNGEMALEAVLERLRNKEPMYELILLDYSMPVMDGP